MDADLTRRPAPGRHVSTSGLDGAVTARRAATAAAAVLALTSTGSIVVVAGLLALCATRRSSGIALAGATVAVAIRFATTDLGDLAGLQSVLGAAGIIGPAAGATSAWFAAAAIVAAISVPIGAARAPFDRVVTAVAHGAFAAVVVVGPGPGGELASRVAATVVFSVLAGLVALIGVPDGPAARPHGWSRRLAAPWRTGLAALAGLAAVVAAVVGADQRATATGSVGVDNLAVGALLVGGTVVVASLVGRRRPPFELAMDVPVAAVVAGAVVAAQGVDRLATAGILLAAGGAVAVVARHRVALIALGPGLAAVTSGVGSSVAMAPPSEAMGVVGAVAVVLALFVVAAPTPGPLGPRPDGARDARLDGDRDRRPDWALDRSTAATGVAVAMALVPLGDWLDDRAALGLGEFTTATTVALAVVGIVATGLARVPDGVTGSLWRRSEPTTPAHGHVSEPEEQAAVRARP